MDDVRQAFCPSLFGTFNNQDLKTLEKRRKSIGGIRDTYGLRKNTSKDQRIKFG